MRLAVARHDEVGRSLRRCRIREHAVDAELDGSGGFVVQDTVTVPVLAPDGQSRSPTSNDVTAAAADVVSVVVVAVVSVVSVEGGQLVSSVVPSVLIVPQRVAPSRFVPLIVAPVRFAREVGIREVGVHDLRAREVRLAHIRAAQVRSSRFAPERLAPDRSASPRFAPDRSAPGHWAAGWIAQPLTSDSGPPDPPQPEARITTSIAATIPTTRRSSAIFLSSVGDGGASIMTHFTPGRRCGVATASWVMRKEHLGIPVRVEIVSADPEKPLAAEAAAKLVEDGMLVGLGTGSTVAFLLPALAARGLDYAAWPHRRGPRWRRGRSA